MTSSNSPPNPNTTNATPPVEPPAITATPAADPTIAQQHLQSPAQILEKSQKTLECIQKTVTEATDEINRTIDENLIGLKSLEIEMKHTGGDHVGPLPHLEKKASTRSLTKKSSESNLSVSNGPDVDTTKNLEVNVVTAKESPIATVKKIQSRESDEKLRAGTDTTTKANVESDERDSAEQEETRIGIGQEMASGKLSG